MVLTLQFEDGTVCKYDEIDADLVQSRDWSVTHTPAGPYFYSGDEAMHRLIIGADAASHVDHRDRDTTHNCRANLRPCDRSKNMMNRGKPKGESSSRFKCVYWEPRRGGAWYVQVTAAKRKHFGGRFRFEIEAAIAADQKIIELHGEFAVTNKMLGLL